MNKVATAGAVSRRPDLFPNDLTRNNLLISDLNTILTTENHLYFSMNIQTTAFAPTPDRLLFESIRLNISLNRGEKS